MRRPSLKADPDPWVELPGRGRVPLGPARVAPARWLAPAGPRRDPVELAVSLVWGLLTLPFRMVSGTFHLAGRLIGVSAGFALMVGGAALSAGPLSAIGIGLFLVGLLLAMRSLP